MYLGVDISAVDVSMLMVLFKAARVKTGTGTEDSFIDIAGYAACGGEIAFLEPDISEKHNVIIKKSIKSTDIPIPDRDAYDRIVSVMAGEIAKFGYASRNLVRNLAGLPSVYDDRHYHYGWTTVDGMELVTLRGKYWLQLPEEEKLDSVRNND